MIPLSGAATKGGKLLFCATWSIDAGDGIDDKLVFCTDLGELLIFTGCDPSDAANWRQEGRYEISPPLGMNATSGDRRRPADRHGRRHRADLGRDHQGPRRARARRDHAHHQADVARARCSTSASSRGRCASGTSTAGSSSRCPGGAPGKQRCLVVNAATGAWARFTGWDATCFIRMRGDMFFGTQDGIIMQADRTGYDDGLPYVATLVGGWEMFQSPSQTITWRQARASFTARAGEPFLPQLSATTDYVVTLPPPPRRAGSRRARPLGPGAVGHGDVGRRHAAAVVRNTGWVSIGMTGFRHAPIVQVTVAQNAKPEVDLIISPRRSSAPASMSDVSGIPNMGFGGGSTSAAMPRLGSRRMSAAQIMRVAVRQLLAAAGAVDTEQHLRRRRLRCAAGLLRRTRRFLWAAGDKLQPRRVPSRRQRAVTPAWGPLGPGQNVPTSYGSMHNEGAPVPSPYRAPMSYGWGHNEARRRQLTRHLIPWDSSIRTRMAGTTTKAQGSRQPSRRRMAGAVRRRHIAAGAAEPELVRHAEREFMTWLRKPTYSHPLLIPTTPRRWRFGRRGNGAIWP